MNENKLMGLKFLAATKDQASAQVPWHVGRDFEVSTVACSNRLLNIMATLVHNVQRHCFLFYFIRYICFIQPNLLVSERYEQLAS